MANLSIIRKLCDDKKWSLRKLADILGISENGMQRILKTNSTKIDTLEKIAELFDVPITVFFQDITKSDFEIVEFRNNALLKVLSVRYESILDKISFLLDSYIWEFAQKIDNYFLPTYPFKHPNRPTFLIDNIEDKSIYIFSHAQSMPFSKWSKEDQLFLRKYSYLFEGFYFSLFRLNLFNIENYLYDGFIQDTEILKHWETWKKIRTEVVEINWKF